MTEYKAKAKGFNGEITAVVDVKDGKVKSIKAEGKAPNTIGALGIDTWLKKANKEKSVDVDAVSGASVSSGAIRKARRIAYAKATDGDIDAITSASVHSQPHNYPLLSDKKYDYDVDEYDGEYDVIVVGAGGAGLSAAANGC